MGTKKTTKIFYPDEHTWGSDPGLSHCSHMQSATQSWHLQRTVWLSEPGMASDVVPAGGAAPSRCTAASGEEAGTTPGSGGGRVLNGRGGEDGGGSRVPKKKYGTKRRNFFWLRKSPKSRFCTFFFKTLMNPKFFYSPAQSAEYFFPWFKGVPLCKAKPHFTPWAT